MICYEGVMVIFPLLEYFSSSCVSFFSLVLLGDCSLSLDSILESIQVPGVGVYDSGNLPLCFIPTGRFSLSEANCVLVFHPLIPSCQ